MYQINNLKAQCFQSEVTVYKYLSKFRNLPLKYVLCACDLCHTEDELRTQYAQWAYCVMVGDGKSFESVLSLDLAYRAYIIEINTSTKVTCQNFDDLVHQCYSVWGNMTCIRSCV